MGNTLSMLTEESIIDILTYADRRSLYHSVHSNREFHIGTRLLLWRTLYLPEHQAFDFLWRLVTTNNLGHFIQHLNLENFEFTDEFLLLLMARTRSMVSVILDNATQITDESMQYVPLYWPQLESIQLTGSTMIHFDVFNTLRHLELWNCSGLDPTTFATNFELETLIIDIRDPIALDLSGLTHLRYLRVHGGLDTETYGWPPNLSSVYLDESFGWMDHDVVPLLVSCPRLTSLTLKDGLLTDTFLALAAMYLPHLTHLDLSYNNQLSANGVRAFVNRANALRLITLSYCDVAMEEFPEAGIHCAGSVMTMTGTVVRLDHLDLEAIERIRRNQLLTE